jgi:penicillin V acylase-like amidase (Ntn superfamily)
MRTLLVQSAACASLLSIALASSHADACTTFCARAESGPLLAKSFDWGTGAGFVVANERGRVRTRLIPGGSNASWTSRFASLSFSTIGPGFPISGMNEAGLTVEALVDLSVTASTQPDPQRLTGLELIQYALDRFDTVSAFASFAEQQGVSQLAVPLHFFTCDATGACAAIESRDGRVHATLGDELHARVLANRPYGVDAQTAPAARAEPLSSGGRFATIYI